MTNITTILKMKLVYKNWFEILYKYMFNIGKYITIRTRSGSTITAPIKDMLYTVNGIWAHKIYGQKPTGVVVDIGANVGAYTVYASETAKQVYAFEPVPSTYALLKQNSLFTVKLFNYAVSNKTGNRYMYLTGRNGDSSLYKPKKCKQKIIVKCITLDKFISEFKLHRIDTLKLDCEGAEYEILLNSRLLSCVHRIIMEYHIPELNFELVIYLKQEGLNLTFHDKKKNIMEFRRETAL